MLQNRQGQAEGIILKMLQKGLSASSFWFVLFARSSVQNVSFLQGFVRVATPYDNSSYWNLLGCKQGLD